MAFCPECNAQMEQTAIVCPECGYDFPQQPTEPTGFAFSYLADVALVLASVLSLLASVVSLLVAVSLFLLILLAGETRYSLALVLSVPLSVISFALYVVFVRVQKDE